MSVRLEKYSQRNSRIKSSVLCVESVHTQNPGLNNLLLWEAQVSVFLENVNIFHKINIFKKSLKIKKVL